LFQNASGLGEIVNLYLDMAVERRNIAKPLWPTPDQTKTKQTSYSMGDCLMPNWWNFD
jgi:hypothetical protein